MSANSIVESVYRVLNPEPLPASSDDLYIDLDPVRGNGAVVYRLARSIRLANEPTCQIVAGHRGSGKSTELKRLQRNLKEGAEKFFVVYCEADNDIDRNDVDFPDVLIAIVRQMAAQLKPLGIILPPGYFKDRWERLKKLLGSEVEFENLDLEAGMMTFSASIKNSPDARLKLRESLEPDTGNWIAAANELIGKAKLELRKHGFKDLVIIVDDLDKMILRPHAAAGCSTGEYLFVHREAQLRAFDCHLVYTMPIALAYSSQVQTIANLYGGDVPVVPMIKIATRPPEGRPFELGIEKLKEMVRVRLTSAGVDEKRVFQSPNVLTELVALSGGQPRELMLLIREALVGSDLPVGTDAVKRAAREGRRGYARQLRDEHWPVIESVKASGSFRRNDSTEKALRELLDNRAILQYVNDDEWYAVNPLVANLTNPAPAGTSQ